MKTSLLFLFQLTILSFITTQDAFGQSDIDTISNRIVTQLHDGVNSIATLDSLVGVRLNTIQPDGTWNDIDYTSTERTIWDPHKHLTRVLDMYKGYTMTESTYYENESLHTSIVNALNYWDVNDLQSSNWWWNQIASPKALGEIMLLSKAGKSPLPATLESNLVSQMDRGDPEAQTGANKIDVAIHFIYRACITEDSNLLQYSLDQAFSPIAFTTGEGLQYDYSYKQHGSQQMISAYGSVFLSGEIQIALWVRGTSYSLSANKLKLLSTYYKDVYLKAIRGSYIDFSTEGRGISRKNGLAKTREKGRLESMKLVDPENNTAWDAAIARTSGTQPPEYMITPGHTHFYHADYSIHQRPDYNFNVRTVSSRTKRTEKGNNENLKGNFLPDGATNIQRRGGEYYNIMPVWEWDKIPGTTSADYTQIPAMTVNWGETGSRAFVGGVSDSIYGATAYDLYYNNTQAKKSWFFFDDEVVCLGAGINSTLSNNIVTTVNQSWLNGDVAVASSSGGATVLSSGTQAQYTNLHWVLHDSIGYFFPQGGNMKISNQQQSGDWYTINNSQPTGVVTGDVFKMWLDHGAQPTNGTYAYIVAPGINNTTEMDAYNADKVTVVKNTASVQAVKHSSLDMMQIVFYQNDTIVSDSVSVTVDKPCIMMLKNVSSSQVEVYIADPTQQQNKITAYFDLPGIEGTKQIKFTMPKSPHAGATVKGVVDANTPDAITSKKGIPVVNVSASDNDGNIPENTIDDSFGTRWSSYGDNQWISYDLGSVYTITKVSLAWYLGDERASTFDVEVSDDGTNWANVYSGTTSGTTLGQEDYDLPETSGRYLRIIGHGNSNSQWNSITETDIFGYQNNTTTFKTIADSYTRNGGYSDTNYGTATYLVAKNDGTGYHRESYVKFDLNSLQGSVSGATLRMYEKGEASDTTWELYKVKNNWTETGITASNAPAAEVLVATAPGIATEGFVTWDIKPVLDTLSSTEVSFKIVSTKRAKWTYFASKEDPNAAFAPTIIANHKQEQITKAEVNAIGDAHTRNGGYSNTNYGSATYLSVKNDGTGYNREAYIQFDISAINGDITQGDLQMHTNTSTNTNWELYKVGNNWTESGITANNVPATETLVDTQPGTSATEVVKWDVSNVLDTLTGNVVSFKIVSTSRGSKEYTSFHSRESSDSNLHPKLILKHIKSSNKARSASTPNSPKLSNQIKTTNILGGSEDKDQLKVYPNPTVEGVVYLSSENVIYTVRVYTQTGMLLKSVENINSNKCEIDLGNFADGLYFVEATGKGFKNVKKVLKMN